MLSYKDEQMVWLLEGISKGFCTPPTCATHEGLHYTPEEQEVVESDDFDSCCPTVVRLPYDLDHAKAIKANANNPEPLWLSETGGLE
jgi:hypothetical protein